KSKTVRVNEQELEPAVESRSAFRNGMDVEDRRNLQALEAISEDGHITQRTLATKLGIALGLTNIYLRRLVRKGYVKAINVQSKAAVERLVSLGIDGDRLIVLRK